MRLSRLLGCAVLSLSGMLQVLQAAESPTFESLQAALKKTPCRECITGRHPRPKAASRAIASAPGVETEPNDGAGNANPLALGSNAGQFLDLSVSGTLSAGDTDYFSFSMGKGDVIGGAVSGGGQDFSLAITGITGAVTLLNDDHSADSYPAASPLPVPPGSFDPAVAFIAPAAGMYLLRVTATFNDTGPYTLNLALRRPFIES